jgi:hypothetical protein
MARNGVKTGGGSRAGVPNKVTKELKDMILGALDDAGGQKYLAEQAIQSPAAFMSLVAKVLPRDMNITADVKQQTIVEIVRFTDENNAS